MRTTWRNHTDRIVGLLLLVQLTGLIVPFIMMGAVAAPGYLGLAAGNAAQIRWALLLLLANGVLTTVIAIALYPRLRTASPHLAVWLVVLGAGMAALQAVDNVQVMGMLSLSQAYVADTLSGELLEVLGAWAAATRRTSHYLLLLTVGTWMLLLYAACWRARVVPRLLSGFGIAAAVLHLTGVSLPVLLGLGSIPPMAMVLAVSHPALAGRLLAHGSDERSMPRSSSLYEE